MPRSARVVAVALALSATSGLTAAPQPKVPDFSGHWVISSTDALAYAPLGAEFTVTQDATSITLASARETFTVRLDGSEAERTTTTVRGDTWRRASQAKFVSFALVITTRVDAGPTGRWEDLMLLSLEGPGRMTFVSSATSKSMQPGMNTSLFRYEKKNDRTVAQTRDLLTQLTVPAGQLPEGCTLTPPRPPYNENPWIARDRKSLSLIQGGIATGFRSPDGPPLTRAELTGMTAALMDHVVEAYQASYMTIGASVEVFAVRYDSSEIATAPSGLKARPGVARERIVIGSTVVSVQSSPVSTRCHDAVVAHIRALK